MPAAIGVAILGEIGLDAVIGTTLAKAIGLGVPGGRVDQRRSGTNG